MICPMPPSESCEGDFLSRCSVAWQRIFSRVVAGSVALVLALWVGRVYGETGQDAWLRYQKVDPTTATERYAQFPAVVVSLSETPVIDSARDELIRGVRGMLEQTLRSETALPKERAIVLGTFDEVKKAFPALDKLPPLSKDGFWLRSLEVDGVAYLLVTSPSDRGVLYGTFALLRRIATGQPIHALNERQSPAAPVRMISQWDRLDGSVGRNNNERSIFWNAGRATKDLDRVRDFARLLASVGINTVSVNDPDAGPRLTSAAGRKELAKLANVFRLWGVRMVVALNSTSVPREDGNIANWQQLAKALQADVPDVAGVLIDADWSTGTGTEDEAVAKLAEAINAIAEAFQPLDGFVVCRTCVCGRAVDESDRDASQPLHHDPGKVAFELFHPLDGKLHDNVVLQIKQGPMDFQVREPPSPLLGAMERTNLAIEFQFTQLHLGQQRHLCFLVPMWKQTLEFDMRAKSGKNGKTPVKEVASGKTFERPLGGFSGVSNARRTNNWLGHDLAMANLYGFGRLAWDPNLTPKAIAEEWTRQTFGHDPLVVGTVVDMLLKSWRIYESYTGPLGAGSLTDVSNTRFGPGIASTLNGGWVPWHDADATGIGKNRTIATGSKFIGQYRPEVAARFESLQTCPDELLLFMHHVPYTHTLKSGKSVIQHIYDSHYHGARGATGLLQQWESLEGRIDNPRFRAVKNRLTYQAGHAQLWRDAVCTWFLDRSGIADGEGRVGNNPNRFEAEALQAEGYKAENVKPWETASGGQCVAVSEPKGKASISLKFDGKAGWYDVRTRYFDENDGVSQFKLLVAGQVVDEWKANDTLPDNEPNGHTSTRRETRRVALRPGDEIRIEAVADGDERAAIDYLEIEAVGNL